MTEHRPKVVATIEARMTSSRLPGKVLMPAAGEPMLAHLVRRLRAVPSIDAIVIATTINDSDQAIVDFAHANGVACFRGSENNVMERVLGAATSASADVIVEITGDCPIIDPDIVEQTIRMFFGNSVDYMSNAVVRSYPDGMDVQVFHLETLKTAARSTTNQLDLEHVSRFIYQHPDIFRIGHLIAPPSLHWPDLGLTLDEATDYQLLRNLIEFLAPTNPIFGCGEAIQTLRERPEWVDINRRVIRKGDS
ncbi:cytidylyltransferase domain-containing protein [Propionivibrio dicarboxylicus]|uniref:Spore coat polysaccharide biosynthesis protein SpsF n=1 Tax=Propionivibrio dicarboxylicus TaxID=83767 RepID=A0A1G8DXW8_9RHOO|nr:glycosyltransferase family protein [Propionivibrio dicarboxylicus]SDH62289.1 spore coat polysaccharide biosynthesis protein SpsF [Propionivibrio dicarboxylicus]